MSLTFMAVGDTAPHTNPPEAIFEDVKDTLLSSDFSFAQVERTFSDRGTYHEPSTGYHSRYDPNTISAYDVADFDVVGLGSNHSLDWGEEALIDTMNNFDELGIEFIGVGKNLEKARKPVVFQKNGISIALLGYCSVLLPQYWATESKPGCTPLRVETFYEPYEYQPGAPARVFTKVWEEDIEALKSDIQDANNVADIVILSVHWGVHYKPKHVANYQKEIAKVASNQGCDLVFGHHPHLVHGIEIYDEMPCVFSLGNFAMPRGSGSKSFLAPNGRFTTGEAYNAEFAPDVSYNRKDHFDKSLLLKMSVDSDKNLDVRLLPVYLDEYENDPRASQPRILSRTDPRFNEVVEFVQWSSEEFNANLEVEENEIIVK